MGEKFENQHYEMYGTVSINDSGDTVKISTFDGAVTDHYSLTREQFNRLEEIARSRNLPTDVFIDRHGDKKLFDGIKTGEDPE